MWQSDVVEARFIMLSPTVAQELLALNDPRRTALSNPDLIDCYANQMRRGQWQFNGDTLKVNRSGGLMDGQHRLQAVIQSGRTIPALVCLGIPDEAAWVMDPPGPRA